MSSNTSVYGDLVLPGELSFVTGHGGLDFVEIENELGRATVALQGAHVVDYQATGKHPLLWLSKAVRFAQGKSIRGGVPVCWPWFGPHPTDPNAPAHGFARTALWAPIETSSLPDGGTRLILALPRPTERSVATDALEVRLTIEVGNALAFELETFNGGDEPYLLTQALHTYFLVGDVRQIQINGFDQCAYLDKVNGGENVQSGPVTISSEVDRIYLNCPEEYSIFDPLLDRTISISARGSSSAVIWNPWVEKAERLGDMGESGHLNMICVETTNAADDGIHLAPGEQHSLSARYGYTA
ncbi:MAG: D-hexose-6-phosphate mutarotase [Gammaproteobacteria bacterium]|nr:D-hexose-6-phosphate mutarotase [Gammaproteobacteria bacterium]